ncbi:hypothetical protein Cgig2_017049 [Carnegiea gigantea]|uniref:Uncharacterized protein n=1 Tax=Carnegiea gigantea TaxID=171969 RepID=A0A9Q1JWX3_9CARY|nr:hypothetical protein Cgig2_017049 [Carnegiea gigantea]
MQFSNQSNPITCGYLCFNLGAWGLTKATSLLRFECSIEKFPPFVYKQGGLFSGAAYWFLSGFHLASSFPIMVFPYYLDTEEMALFVWETFSWHLRSTSRPPLPLLMDHHDLCHFLCHGGQWGPGAGRTEQRHGRGSKIRPNESAVVHLRGLAVTKQG